VEHFTQFQAIMCTCGPSALAELLVWTSYAQCFLFVSLALILQFSCHVLRLTHQFLTGDNIFAYHIVSMHHMQ